MYYNIEEFNKILFDGFEYKLPDNVISSIEILNSEIEKYISSTSDNSSITVTPNLKYKKPTYVNNARRNKMGGNVKKTEEDWETIRNFKPGTGASSISFDERRSTRSLKLVDVVAFAIRLA